MLPEETKLRDQGCMTRPLLEKKWELERAKTCLYRRQDEFKEQKERVEKLSKAYVKSLRKALEK